MVRGDFSAGFSNCNLLDSATFEKIAHCFDDSRLDQLKKEIERHLNRYQTDKGLEHYPRFATLRDHLAPVQKDIKSLKEKLNKLIYPNDGAGNPEYTYTFQIIQDALGQSGVLKLNDLLSKLEGLAVVFDTTKVSFDEVDNELKSTKNKLAAENKQRRGGKNTSAKDNLLFNLMLIYLEFKSLTPPLDFDQLDQLTDFCNLVLSTQGAIMSKKTLKSRLKKEIANFTRRR